MSSDKDRAGSGRQPWYRMWSINSEDNDFSSTDIVAPEHTQQEHKQPSRSFMRSLWKRSERSNDDTNRSSMDDGQNTPRQSLEGEHDSMARRSSLGDAFWKAQKDKETKTEDKWSSWTCA
eukprot:TRINITY_DN1086_c0_g1_i1.p2 TRINITY_DN1086_c0_g1~~TRINITY_DN1086_c0_g1_i1.p2  ORF type:complete len:120 (+),score=13.90 TRINITY_DN1086_c0_g1_i1:163-522(+)